MKNIISLLILFLFWGINLQAQYQVRWKNKIDIDVQDTKIIKTKGWSWYNGAALSINKLRKNTDGKMSYIIRGTETLMMVGLSESNNIGHYNSIQYAIYYRYGTLEIWESGVPKGSFGALSTGDTLMIERFGDSIRYKKHGINGVNSILRVTQTNASKELFVDLSIYYPLLAINHVNCDFDEELTIWDSTLYYQNTTTGALGSISVNITGHPPFNYNWSNGDTTKNISGLTAGTYTLTVTDAMSDTAIKEYLILSEKTYQVKWKNLINLELDTITNKLIKTNYYGWNNTSALSINKLSSYTDGRLQYVYTGEEKNFFFIGLTEKNNSTKYSDIQHRLYIHYNTSVSNNISIGDTIIIERLSNLIYFRLHKIDGTQKIIKTEPTDPIKNLYIDVSCVNTNQKVNSLTCSFPYELSISKKTIYHQNLTKNSLGSITTNTIGSPPFTYNWSNGATSQNIYNLTAGEYTLTVTDSLGDTTSKTFKILAEKTYPVEWHNIRNYSYIDSTNKLKSTAGYGWSTGALSVNILPPYTNGKIYYVYQGNEKRFVIGFAEYNETPSYGNTILYGLYFYNSIIGGISRTQGDTIILERRDSTLYYHIHRINGSQTTFGSKYCDPSKKLHIGVTGYDRGHIVNNMTCTFKKGLTIDKVKVIHHNTTNNTLGSISLNVTGPPPLTYSWSNGATTKNISNLTAGTYTLTVVDGEQQSFSRSFLINTEEIYNINWTNIENYHLDTNTNELTKVSSSSWNAGALSANKLPANTNGKITQTFHINHLNRMIGFSEYNEIANYNSINYAIFLYSNQLWIRESGINRWRYRDLVEGDQIIIERLNDKIIYSINGVDGKQYTIRTVTTDPTKELYIDVSGMQANGKIRDVTCSFNNQNLAINLCKLQHQNTTQNTLGSININITGKAPFTYAWSNGETSKNISGLTAGSYTLTVTDANNNSISKTFDIIAETYFQVNWQNIQNFSIDTTTNILTSDAYGLPQWSSGALSRNMLPANTDGKVRYTVNGNEYHLMIGLSDDNNIATHTSILHKLYIYNNTLQGYNGSLNIGDVLEIERRNDKIIFRKFNANNTLQFIKTESTDPTKELFVDIASRISNHEVSNMVCTFGIPNPKCDVYISTNDTASICPGEFVELILYTGTNNQYDHYDFTWTPNNTISSAPVSSTTNTLTFLASPTTLTDYVLQYTFYTAENLIVCSNKIHHKITINPNCNSEKPTQEIVGCCFGNFGTGVYIGTQTNLNIYCNLLNDLGSNNENITKGEFLNKGNVNVELDWIHNAKNNLYVTAEGGTNLIGAEQQMRGISSTHYYNLNLKGNNKTKEILVDEYIENKLQLNNNELATIDNALFIENTSVNAISRINGYISTDGTGNITRNISNSSTTYIYPIGSQSGVYRYRPLEVTTGNNPLGTFSVNFQNKQIPALLDPTSKAPNVQSLNTEYYYKFNTTSLATDLKIETYYPISEGPYQSLSQWKSSSSRWEMSPVANVNYIPSTSSNTLGLLSSSSIGIQSYNSENFTLSRAGFYINTGAINGGNDGSIVITVNNANDTNGNGINDSDETGVTIDSDSDGIPDNVDVDNTGGADTDGDGIDDNFDTTPTGGSTNNGGLNSPNTSDNDNDIFTPSPIAGTYNISILSSNNCTEPGIVQFTVDSSGQIVNNSITNDITQNVKFISENNIEGYLSSDLFEIDTMSSGLLLKSKPKNLLLSCINEINILMGTNEPFILSMQEMVNSQNIITENIEITLPNLPSLDNSTFKIYSINNTNVFSSNIYTGNNSITIPPSTWIEEGVYHFELILNGTSEIVKGQFIIR